ncbi:MAG: glycosyltransferase family 2 protein [Brevinematales bacterium]|nr:glycosyltransferase family 2 protein [Brevinematales bacterium]
MKVLVIVPAYNEEEAIARVIDDLRSHVPDFDILVVSDGSRDRTASIARKKGVSVVELPTNLGIGGAVQTGLKYAYRYGYDVAVQFDGDGQHVASEITKLLDPLKEGRADAVIGSRFLPGQKSSFQSTIGRRIGIWFFEILNSLLIRQRITDNTSGFRAYNKEVIDFMVYNYPTDYPEPEAVILLGRNRFRIVEVPTEMRERVGGKSSIFGWRSAYYMIKVTLAIVMTALRYRLR